MYMYPSMCCVLIWDVEFEWDMGYGIWSLHGDMGYGIGE